MSRKKLIRATTVPMSLKAFCEGVLRDLSEEYEVVALSSPDPDLDYVGEREGVRTIAVPMQRRISLWHDIVSLVRMICVLLCERPYAIHSMTPKAGMICMTAAWLTRVPVRLHTFTGLVWPTASGMMRKILMAADWLICACATHINPEGEGVKADLLTITRKRLDVLGHGNVRGINLEHYNRTPQVMSAAQELRKDGVFTFVFVGRIAGDKGINELVEAFVRLHKETPTTRLLLVGYDEQDIDPLSARTNELIEGCDAIVCTGVTTDVRPWYAVADALVFPSYREGFPNVVLEAGAMGLPAIVTDINGSREIIIDGYNGVIVPIRDADALYDAMREYVNNGDMVAKHAAVARQSIAERFEQGYVRQCLYDYYRQIMS